MDERQRSELFSCLRLMLKPIVRFALKHSLKITDLLEAAKIEFIQEARSDLFRQKRPLSNSRLSIMTGIHRRDVARLAKDSGGNRSSTDLLSRVLGTWQAHPKFSTSRGKPRTLCCEGKRSEFCELVSHVSKELNPYTVLFELERVGAVERSLRGLRIRRASYIPKGNAAAGFEILSRDMSDLVEVVSDNVLAERTQPHHHLRTEYDAIDASQIEQIEKWLLAEGSAFHRRARCFLSKFDRYTNPRAPRGGRRMRVVFGSFARTDDYIAAAGKVCKRPKEISDDQ